MSNNNNDHTYIASVVALYILARFRLQVLPLVALFAAVSVDWALRAWADRWVPEVCAPMRHSGNHRYLFELRRGTLTERAEREAQPYPKLDLFGQAW